MNSAEGIQKGASPKGTSPRAADRYVGAVARFADAVLESGRDEWGGAASPLFADGLHAETLEPAIWIWQDRRRWLLSNLASQQPLLRLLDGLTALTGAEKYRAAAEEAAAYALRYLCTPNGLLYWGGHTAWDLLSDGPCGTWFGRVEAGVEHYNHELKAHQPWFEFFWRLDPAATRTLMEGLWGGHVVDWSLLDFNRHAETWAPIPPQWDSEFDAGAAVPFPSRGDNLSFCHVTMPLMRAGVLLAVLGNDPRALVWVKRLVYRWQQARDPATGLSGGQLSYRRRDRAWEALGHVHPHINEAKIVGSYHQTARYHMLPLAQMQAGEVLRAAGGTCAEVGDDFVAWASDDLKTYARQCFDPGSRRFVAKMTDGTPIEWKSARTDYYRPAVFAPCRPDGWLFWGYALAYRLTGDAEHWGMLAALAPEFGLTSWPASPAVDAAIPLKVSGGRMDWRALYGLLEVAAATGRSAYLDAACRIADRLLEWQRPSGLFTRPARAYPDEEAGEQIHHAVEPGTRAPASVYGRTGDEVPLALLHLAAALKGRRGALPQPVLDERYFHAPYYGELEPHQRKWNDNRTYDWLVFYGEE